MIAVMKKEFKGLFSCPIGYSVLAVLFCLSGAFFFLGNLLYQSLIHLADIPMRRHSIHALTNIVKCTFDNPGLFYKIVRNFLNIVAMINICQFIYLFVLVSYPLEKPPIENTSLHIDGILSSNAAALISAPNGT